MQEIDKYKVSVHYSIRDAVKKMDEGGIHFCVAINDDRKVAGVISDGDFRYAVHNGIQLDESVSKIINRNFYYVQKGYDRKEAETIFSNTIVRQIPVLDNGELVDIILPDRFYCENKEKIGRCLNNPVVIMAGGKGARLDPFTRILPKPLIPLGNDPIIKVIMDEFHKTGISHFYISLKEKERMVRAYFYEHRLGYQIDYIHEDKPLGTAGALKNLEGKVEGAFFVSNCDIIIRADYGAFYDFHKKGGYGLTMISSMRQYTIPYGVCEIGKGGILKAIQEKPQYDFLVNTGLYLLEPTVLRFVPEGVYFDMTDLIRTIRESGVDVGVFPVSEKSWIDVGQWAEYNNIIKEFSQ